MPKKQTEETQILGAVCEYLEYKKYYFFRLNNIPVFDTVRKTFRAFPKWSVKGLSDILLLHKRHAYFLEMKGQGKYQSKEQKKFQADVEAQGFTYAVIRSVEDVMKLGL